MPTATLDLTGAADRLAEANRRLGGEPVAPDEIVDLVLAVADAIDGAPREQWASVPPDDWIELQRVAMRAQRVALGEKDRRAQRRQLRLLIEELRFRLARLAEQAPYGVERSADDVVRWLDGALPVAQSAKAELLGVHERTYQRWASASDASRPAGEDDRRVRLIARVAGDLRHVLTGPGVVSWLRSPQAELEGRTPLEVIDEGDPGLQRRLFELVGAARAGAAG